MHERTRRTRPEQPVPYRCYHIDRPPRGYWRPPLFLFSRVYGWTPPEHN